jgi:hypothetical protein
VYDPYALSGATVDLGVGTTTMPAHLYGPEPLGVGTFLVSTGWSDGVTEFVAVIRLDNPTGVVAWNYQLLSVGDISRDCAAVRNRDGADHRDDPQRCMNAVAQQRLYTFNAISPRRASAPGHAHWYRIGTLLLPALVVADQTTSAARTSRTRLDPRVMVDVCDNAAVDFSASNTAFMRGTRVAWPRPGGTISGSTGLALGTGWYIRASAQPTAASRWGDFSPGQPDR